MSQHQHGRLASPVGDRHSLFFLPGLTGALRDGSIAQLQIGKQVQQATMQRKPDKQPAGHETKLTAAREWTAVEKFRLKGLAKQAQSAEKIARTLKRPIDATVAMATKLGYRLM